MDATLQRRHNDHNGVSNHQPHDCLLNRLFILKSKNTWELRVNGLCLGNSPVTGEFPAQRASNAENVSIGWRHHEEVLHDFSRRWVSEGYPLLQRPTTFHWNNWPPSFRRLCGEHLAGKKPYILPQALSTLILQGFHGKSALVWIIAWLRISITSLSTQFVAVVASYPKHICLIWSKENMQIKKYFWKSLQIRRMKPTQRMTITYMHSITRIQFSR